MSEISISKTVDESGPSHLRPYTPMHHRSRSPLLALNDKLGQDISLPVKEHHSETKQKPTVNQIYESPSKLKIGSSNYLSSKSLK